MQGASLEQMVEVLSAIAPPRLAAKWDNTGLIVEGTRSIKAMLLCIDLTETVLAEAIEGQVDAIVAYHPPMFRGVKRLTARTPSARVVLGAIRLGLHVYSPHTALDAAAGGLNDWLIEAFGAVGDVRPLEPHVSDPEVGFGRRATLASPLSLSDVVGLIKKHLELDNVRVAAPPELEGWGQREIKNVAVCPGAGGSVFEGVDDVDLLLTGEMRHHDVLARVSSGTAVVLTEHTNTERGYLPRLAERLTAALQEEVTVTCSDADTDPLVVW
ncbi:MAG: Nif3-like dinuclear metal center hexameric protein [Myxococcales bacterium]|nr:Nif3-like dinuclear metal center hexameric protein [Myxococcales bacterium]